MYYNGKTNYRVSTFMNQVHAAVSAKYNLLSSNDAQQARQLQIFFQKIKAASINKKKGFPIRDEAINLIINTIQEIMKEQGHGAKITNLFQKRGGKRFQNQLEMVILAVLRNVSDEELKMGDLNISIGSNRVSSDVNNFIDDMSQKILEEVGTKTIQNIKNEEGQLQKVYYMQEVDGKIDTRGVTVTIKANPNEEILKYYNLLRQATFTDKNYDSLTWDKKAQVFFQQSGHTTIKLGKTNPFRSIYSVLSDLGYDDKVSKSAFYAGWHRIYKNDQNVINHFFHLRYIYELTGVGLKYDGENFGQARFLIYNDPHGGIFVRSTAEILSQILNSKQNVNNALSGISIAKAQLERIGQLSS